MTMPGHNAVDAERRSPWTRLIIVAILIVIAGAIVWRKAVREHVFPKRFGVVEQGAIYRSGQLTPRMIAHVCEGNDIRTIIALNGSDRDKPHAVAEAQYAEAHGVDRFVFDLIGDGTGDPKLYADVLKLMVDPAHQPVLVHCAAGSQRAGVATLLYRHIVQGQPIREAYEETLRYDHEADEWQMLAYIADNIETIRREFSAP